LSLVVLHGVNYIIPLFTYPFLFRILGAERFGLVNFALSFMQYFIILTDFGFNLSAVKKISENRDNQEIVQRTYNNVMYAKIILMILSFVTLLFLIWFNNKFSGDVVLFLLAYTTVIGNSIFPIWFFQGMEKMKFITVINVVTKIIAFLPMFYIIRESSQFDIVPAFYGLGYLIAGFAGMFVIKHNFKINLIRPNIRDIFNELKDSFFYFISRISLSIYTVTNVVVIGFALSDVAVGYYSAAEKIYIAITGIYAPFIWALYPYMSRTKNLRILKKLLLISSLLNAIMIVGIMVFTNPIMSILYKDISPDITHTFRILLLSCFLYAPSVLLGYPLLGVTGHEKQANASIIFSSLFHIILLFSLYLFNLVTIYNIAIAIVITTCVELFLRIYWVNKFKLLRL
jgi:PST family polysaccharide transporter